MSRAFNCSRLALVAGTAMALTACLDHPLKPVEYDKSEEAENTVAIAINKDVDILFVIDNSGSMAEEQQRVAENFAAFINVLEAEDVGANYRIGITTTDAGNPRCPSTTPENGNLVLSSCLNRIDDGQFLSQDTDYSAACTANCDLRDEDLEILGTATELDEKKAPRKWIERINGVSNVSGTDSMVKAFQCYGPQGVAGCGFESHLESMYKGLAAAKSEKNKNNFGFLRAAAILSIVIITDEADCSYNPDWGEIFTTNKAFWYDPAVDVAPTSSMCWKAGVSCEGNAPNFDTCRAADWNKDFQEADDPDSEAVLFPVDKYVQFVTELEKGKQEFDPDQQVLVSLIAGVPIGYENFDAEIPYVDSPDLAPGGYQSLFGIGPGCIVGPANMPTATAVPPVREREFAEAFNVDDDAGRNLYSICDDDYSAALADIADKIRDQIKPACMPNCVRDTKPETTVVEPNCQLYEENLVAQTRNPIAVCTEVNGEWTAPAGETVCFATLTDDGSMAKATPSMIDNMSPECVEDGFNLEFILVRSGAAPAGTTISAACELSDNKKKDCPML